MDVEKPKSTASRRKFFQRSALVAGAVAAATVAQEDVAQASPGSPALYFNSFGYAPAGQSIADLVSGIANQFTHTSGYYNIRTGSNWVAVRTANTQGFVEFVGSYPNTVAVVVSAGDDSSPILSQMVYLIQHTYWL